MHDLKPLGKTSVPNGVKEIAQRLDLKYWESFGGQALRALVATKLGDDDGASTPESIAALRHTSASAHKHHNETSGVSETSKYKALGVTKKQHHCLHSF